MPSLVDHPAVDARGLGELRRTETPYGGVSETVPSVPVTSVWMS